MAWTKIDDPTTTWTIITIGGWFKSQWFQGWFQNLVPAIWTIVYATDVGWLVQGWLVNGWLLSSSWTKVEE